MRRISIPSPNPIAAGAPSVRPPNESIKADHLPRATVHGGHLHYDDTQQSLFFHRMSRLRIEHETALDRLTSHLEIKQHRRKRRDLHREALANALLPPVSQ